MWALAQALPQLIAIAAGGVIGDQRQQIAVTRTDHPRAAGDLAGATRTLSQARAGVDGPPILRHPERSRGVSSPAVKAY